MAVKTTVKWSEDHPTVIVRTVINNGASVSDYVRANREDREAKLTEEDFTTIMRKLQAWVDNHAEPDKDIMYVGQEQFTPRQILNYFSEQRPPIANIINNVPTMDFIESLDRVPAWRR